MIITSRTFFLLVGLSFLTSTAGAQGTSVLSGIVRDQTGAPVREALVVVDPDSLSLRARSGVDGRYRITGVPQGRFEVRVVRIGFRPRSLTVDVTSNATELNIDLESVPIPLDTIAVRVTRPGLYGLVVTRGINLLPHEPRPLPNATIEVLNEPHRTKSGADGRFSIPQLGIGSHSILVTLDRFTPRMVPVTVPPDGGVDITFTIDSIFADYQRWDADRIRGITRRLNEARSPATFVSAHELDADAPDLKEALRYAHSVLSRGIIVQNVDVCIYIDAVPRGDLRLEDVQPIDIQGIEVYPEASLPSAQSMSTGNGTGNRGVPCYSTRGDTFSPGERGRGSFSRRTLTRTRGNQGLLVMIWTTKRR